MLTRAVDREFFMDKNGQMLTLRQAALIAGVSYLLMPVSFAEFYIYPMLIIRGDIAQTAQNIRTHGSVFAAAILCYLTTLVLDVIIAWALYILVAPVNRAVSLLAAWFRLIYTAIAFSALSNLLTVYRLLHAPDYLTAFGLQPLHAQVMLLLNSYRYESNMGLIIFGLHLCLLGCLSYKSWYIPKMIGILLGMDGLGWVIDPLRPYLYPNSHVGSLFIQFFPFFAFSELVLPLWLVIRGWKIQEPAETVAVEAREA
jgi:hypothetical protein